MLTVSEIVTHLDERYPPVTAEPWDAVGLIVGEPGAPVRRILTAVDVDPKVVQEAIELQVDMIVTHHPLYLSGTTSVATSSPKGRMVHDLITNGIALYNAHTNADIAPGGVNEALAELLGLTELEPLAESTHPEAHPGSGIGRIGRLEPPMTLTGFAELVAERLPATEHGVRVNGPGDRRISRVAVCGGSGDSYLDAAHAAGVDVYLTADLRHHRAQEAAYRPNAPALVDVAHYASEWPWIPRVAEELREEFGLEVHVSTLNTDPWTARLGTTTQGDSL